MNIFQEAAEMGLDMYLKGEKFYWTNWKQPDRNLTEDGFKMTEKHLELGYWRKHADLHGFIVRCFADGVDECQRIDLDEGDLRKIILAIKHKKLPHTEGFFFGASAHSQEERDEAVAVFKKALTWIAEKEPGVARSVYYEASW